jgi:prepilin-type N-terminal cleavage/methylation domain-containing protein/prepilin-type processing-associated H-X9-DG protein
MKMKFHRRTVRGFTLVELLVVISIIGVLVGLLLPAVQAAREAARRMSCGNNIRQIALGAINYEGAFRSLPLNYSTIDPTVAGAGQNQASWMTMILPNIEQNAIYQQFSFSLAPFAGTNLQNASQTINLYRCPSDVTPRDSVGNRTGSRTLNPESFYFVDAATTSYVGCAGSNWAWGTPPIPPHTVVYNTATDPEFRVDPFLIKNGNAYGNGNGIFFPGYRGVKGLPSEPNGRACQTLMAAIKDGTSNTIMIGESVGSFSRFNWWYSAEGSSATCAISPNANPRCALATTGRKRLDLIACDADWQNNYGFMSEHSGGCQFALADGSVRFIPDTIDTVAYRRLGSMMDGGVVTIPD